MNLGKAMKGEMQQKNECQSKFDTPILSAGLLKFSKRIVIKTATITVTKTLYPVLQINEPEFN
jgi:hypothetical protein